jgi:hypothetical protein
MVRFNCSHAPVNTRTSPGLLWLKALEILLLSLNPLTAHHLSSVALPAGRQGYGGGSDGGLTTHLSALILRLFIDNPYGFCAGFPQNTRGNPVTTKVCLILKMVASLYY